MHASLPRLPGAIATMQSRFGRWWHAIPPRCGACRYFRTRVRLCRPEHKLQRESRQTFLLGPRRGDKRVTVSDETAELASLFRLTRFKQNRDERYSSESDD